MRKALILFCLSLAIFRPDASNAQGNFPFPSTFAEWSYYTVLPLIGPTDHFSFNRDFISGDSVFQGKHYTKFYTSTLCACNCSSVNGPLQPSFDQSSFLRGGLREEAGKVYYTNFGTPPFNSFFRPVVDTVLFDFTLQLGDTMLYDDAKLIVIGIDTTPEGRRVIQIEGRKPLGWAKIFNWVEGIGGPFGPLETLPFIRDSKYYDGNSCFSQDQPWTCPVPCALVLDAESPDRQEDIRIYPSFAEDFVTVSAAESFGPFMTYLYAGDGRLLKSTTSEYTSCQVPVFGLPKGVYHFVLVNASGVRVSKTYVHP